MSTTRAAWRQRVAALLDRPDRLLVVALLLTVAIRVVAVAATDAASVDTYEFGVMGKNLEVGRGFSYFAERPDGLVEPDDFAHEGTPLPSAFMPPVYVGIVAGALETTASDLTAIRLLQGLNVVLALATAWLVFAIATRLADRRAGALAALAYACYPPLVYQATQVSASNVYVPLELLAILLFLRIAAPRPSTRAVVAAAGLLGALALLRSEAVALLLLAAVWLWFVVERGARTRLVALFLVVGALLPAAWVVRNSIVLDRFVPTITTTGGFNLYIGNHEGATGSQKEFDDDLEPRAARIPASDSYEVERDELYMDAAVDSMTEDPLGTIARDVKKLGMLLTADFYDSRSKNPVYFASWLPLLALGAYGLATYRGRRPVRALLYGYIGFSVLIPTVFFTLARYKLPLELMMMVFASLAVTRLVAPAASPGDDEPRTASLIAARTR